MSPSIADLVRLDSVCDAFEESWKAGSRPRLEEYLESTNLPSATLFVELVQIDIDYRRRHGETPSVGEYAAKFPQFEEALSEIASLLGTTDATVSVPAKPLPMLGRFELAAELGRGSFGVVWKAWDTKMRRWVALKQFHEGIARGNRKLYEREARAVAQLDHPNVVRVLELSEGSSSDYIVFELIEGESLKSWLAAREGKPVDPRLAAQIVLQIAQGLQHVHERDIVHRDLKPGNILITKEGVPKLVDFGLARHLDSLSTIAHDKTLLGTIPYMSPEQCRSEKVTAATDIYSLGVVLYELLAGRRPFAGVQSELLAQIQYRPAPPLQPKGNVPADLERICRRAIEKEPLDRYTSVRNLASDLGLFLRGEPIGGGWIPYRKFARKLLIRRSLLKWTLGATAVVAAYGVIGRLPRVDDGLMRVRITSEPPGAVFHFVPLDGQTGIPQADNIIHAPIGTPTDIRLEPGDYLTIAVLDDGRFHEVYRHVPQNPDLYQLAFRHLNWKIENDGITLPTVQIPEQSVTDTMAYVDADARFSLSVSEAGRKRLCSIPAFYVDTGEITVGQYKEVLRKIYGEERSKRLGVYQPADGDDRAKSVSFDEAIARAEAMGKRLLHPFEFNLLMTSRGNSPYPWGKDLPIHELMPSAPEPVGHPAFDKVLSHGVAIRGVGSNVAEWVDGTMTGTPKLRPLDGTLLMKEATASVRGDFRVFELDLAKRPAQPNPDLHTQYSRHLSHPGIGFRCARSARPRVASEDFVRVLPDVME